jgi:hypothetical protein
MTNFKDMLYNVLCDMANGNDNMCCAIYIDSNFSDNAIVMFMELGDYASMHELMEDLHLRLSKELGHSVCICHNHPTDESVLIHSNKADAEAYAAEECCGRQTVGACIEFLQTRTGYRPELRALALGAEAYADMCGKRPFEVLMNLDWNEEPMAQLLMLFVEAYDETQK